MSMICPKCHSSYENNLQCPKCGVMLVLSAALRGGDGPSPVQRGKWHQAPAGRIFAGWVVSLGLTYGLLQLSATVLGFLGYKPGGEALRPGAALGLFYGLQALALLVGGLLAGVGRRGGIGFGATVGLLSGAASLACLKFGLVNSLFQVYSSDLLSLETPARPILVQGVAVHLIALYGLPAVQILCGALGGFAGSFVWKPPAELAMPAFVPVEPKPIVQPGLQTSLNLPNIGQEDEPSLFAGPIAWIRVIFGIGVAIGGVVWSRQVVGFIVDFSDKYLEIRDMQQEWVTTGEVFALSILIGGTIAGATTPNGLKQGLVVGVGAGIGQAIFLIREPQFKNYLIFVVLSSIFLAPLGGWFGTSLLPPRPPARETTGDK